MTGNSHFFIAESLSKILCVTNRPAKCIIYVKGGGLMHSISKNLKLIRQQRGWTQQQMADVLFVTRQTVSNWENGKSMPDIDMLASIAEKLDTDVNCLLYGPPAEDSNLKKDIIISLLLIIVGLFFRLVRIPIRLSGSLSASFAFYCKNYLAVIFAYAGLGMFVCQFMKGANFITRTAEYRYSKHLRCIFALLYILQFVLLLPYVIREFFFYLTVLHYPPQYAGMEKAAFSIYEAVNRIFFSDTTILVAAGSWLAMKIFSSSFLFSVVVFVSGFIYDVLRPFNGPVNIPAFNRIKAFIESPAEYTKRFLLTVKSNLKLYKKEFVLLAAVFCVAGLMYIAAGFACGWKDITENSFRYMAYEQETPMMLCHIVQKHISAPVMWIAAGRIGATMVKTAGFSLSEKLKKRFRLIFVIYLSVYFILILINDMHYFIQLWQSEGLLTDSAITDAFIGFMRFPPGIMKKAYRFFHSATNGKKFIKMFVFSFPAFLTNLTNKKAAD